MRNLLINTASNLTSPDRRKKLSLNGLAVTALSAHRQNNTAHLRTIISALFLTTLLSACGGGGGGGGQKPDPVAVDNPIAYVKRSLPVDDNGDLVPNDILNPTAFNPGAELLLRTRANIGSPETNISILARQTDATFTDEPYDVKDLAVSHDGERLVFSMRAPDDDDATIPITWNIWEYNRTNGNLRRLISSNILANEGDDVNPHYLPNGSIVFSSNRQQRSQAIYINEGRSPFRAITDNVNDRDPENQAFVLHTMDEDGGNIEQITFNQSHDLYPSVRDDGRITYLRWDRAEGRNNLSLYVVNPDGSNQELLYGYHSQNTGTNDSQATFTDVSELPNGQLLAILRPRESENFGGDMVAIKDNRFIDIAQPVASNLGDTSQGQASITLSPVTIDDTISRHGYFNSAFPLFDGTNRLIVSWNPCRLREPGTTVNLACTDDNLNIPNIEEAPPLYGVWIYDLGNETQLPVLIPEEGIMYSDVVAMESRVAPTVITPTVSNPDTDASLFNDNLAILHIRSVYDLDGVDTTPAGIAAMADPAQTLAADRPARFLRVTRAVSIPDEDLLDFDNAVFGVNRNRGMREIMGYVPIEPDGSVKVVIPAEIPFHIDIVDADGQRVSSIGTANGQPHRNWLQLSPGEERECSGCHSANSTLPHGRADASLPSAYAGAPATGIPFINTVATLSPDQGDTMAEVYARQNGTRTLSVDMEYVDEWTDPAVRTPDTAFTNSYAGVDGLQTQTPVTNTCRIVWPLCESILTHYPEHIQPIWEVSRPDGAGGDNRCTSCHSRLDNNGMLQQPAAQLELTSLASDLEPLHVTSYQELLRADQPQILNFDGSAFLTLLVLRVIDGEQQFFLDDNGDPIVDINGDPIPEVTVAQPGDNNLRVASFDNAGNPIFYLDSNGDPITDANNNPIQQNELVDPAQIRGVNMVAGSAAASDFFDAMNGAAADHSGMMSASELRLIREWLDNGAQYYNDPFAAPPP